jgi:amino acid transporter
MLKKPRFLATCVFGLSFIIFANTATNSVAFAVAIMHAANVDIAEAQGRIAIIAIVANTFCCLLHSMSRKWGIRLNNAFGTVKLAMLVLIIIFGFVWLDKDVANANLNTNSSFATSNITLHYTNPPATYYSESPKGVYRYAESAVIAMFPFGGFHQANYVSPLQGLIKII